ncbi:hypothetical protein ANTRET_LOCUS5070 [Anthophora retusa]
MTEQSARVKQREREKAREKQLEGESGARENTREREKGRKKQRKSERREEGRKRKREREMRLNGNQKFGHPTSPVCLKGFPRLHHRSRTQVSISIAFSLSQPPTVPPLTIPLDSVIGDVGVPE